MFSYKDILNNIKTKEVYDLIIIEGVVGVGKTSLMEALIPFGYTPFEEPVVDNPILDKFYFNRERYAFPLQVFFLNKRFEHIKSADEAHNAVMDRSIYGDAIFAKMLNVKGEMSDEEFQIYTELLANMLQHVKRPKLIVYLEVSTDVAMQRIQMRGRDYEQHVEREYWQDLNDEYKEYFNAYELSPILKINVDELDFKHNEADKQYVLNLIQKKLKEIDGE